jgi:nucleoid DNA-binding protein
MASVMKTVPQRDTTPNLKSKRQPLTKTSSLSATPQNQTAGSKTLTPKRTTTRGRGKSEGLTKTKLTQEIADILQIPTRGRPRYGLANTIQMAIFKTIVDCLRRGEEVWIPGFGKLKVRTRPARKSACVYYYHVNNKGSCVIKNIPARKYVHFQPSKVVLRNLNGNTQSGSKEVR